MPLQQQRTSLMKRNTSKHDANEVNIADLEATIQLAMTEWSQQQVAASAEDVAAEEEGRCEASTSDAAPRPLAAPLDADSLEIGLRASVRTRELSLAQLRRSTEALSLLTVLIHLGIHLTPRSACP